MNILLCNYEYPPLGGGGGAFCQQVAEEFAHRHQVTVLTSAVGDQLDIAIENGVEVIRVPSGSRPDRATASVASMARYVRNGLRVGRRLVGERRFDVINSYFAVPTGPVGHRLAALSDTPHVLTILGGDIYDPSKSLSPHRHWLLRRAIRHLLTSAASVVAESRDIANNMNRYYTDSVDCALIPLGIQRPPEPGPADALELPGGGRRTLVTVGRLVRRKAVEQLIDVTAALPGDTDLVVVGDGPLRPELEAHAARAGIARRVHFLGHVSEELKFEALRRADLFVSSSQHEGFGLVFLEAMACGLPVVCYDEGGQTDFLDDRTGFVVPLNARAELTERCRALLADETLRRQRAEAARQRAEGYFIDRCAKRYEELFDGLIGDARSDAVGA